MRQLQILIGITVSTLLFFSSCKKQLQTDLGKSDIELSKNETSALKTANPYKRTIVVGTGSGNLIIDGKTMELKCSDLIKIRAGSYSNITIKNILSADGCPITIKNKGLVQIVGNFNTMDISDVSNVTVSGNGTEGLEKGFVFRDNTYRAVNIGEATNKFKFQFVAFKNIGNMVISLQYNKVYNGSASSYLTDLKFLNISCENTNQFIGASGSVENGKISGLIKNIEIAYLDFQNAAGPGAVVYMGNAENYDIHNNRINNINTATNNHNGIFTLAGNGRFYNNYVSNHQGNAIRAWGHTIGTKPKEILIYNNIVVNSRKYSAFEVQAFDANITAGKTTYVNATVFNNTCGRLNISKDWQGNIVDVYSLKGGKCDVYNNIGYNIPGVSAGQQSDLIPTWSKNLLTKTYSKAGIVNETTYKLTAKSKAKNKGRATKIVITDYYGTVRNSLTPSIGAVE